MEDLPAGQPSSGSTSCGLITSMHRSPRASRAMQSVSGSASTDCTEASAACSACSRTVVIMVEEPSRCVQTEDRQRVESLVRRAGATMDGSVSEWQ